MAKGNIYWFTGQTAHGKTTLAVKLVELLQTERRNWRKDVFHIDDIDGYDTTHTQLIAEYLSNNGCDVVVSVLSPSREIRESFKDKVGVSSFQEFYIHKSTKKRYSTDYQPPTDNFFEVDTTKDKPEHSFTKIVNYLKDNNRL